jgi:hypothetical protein
MLTRVACELRAPSSLNPSDSTPPNSGQSGASSHTERFLRSTGPAQLFLSAFSGISPHVRPRRHLMTAADHRHEMAIRLAIWDQVSGVTGRPAAA